MYNPDRRTCPRATGLAAVAGLDGCTGDGTDGDEADSLDDYPAIDEWLTKTELGGDADYYDGTLLDPTGRDTVTIAVR